MNRSKRQHQRRSKRKKEMIAAHQTRFLGSTETRVARMNRDAGRMRRKAGRSHKKAVALAVPAALADLELARAAETARQRNDVYLSENVSYERHVAREKMQEYRRQLQQSYKVAEKARLMLHKDE